jgi:hypothetical protein
VRRPWVAVALTVAVVLAATVPAAATGAAGAPAPSAEFCDAFSDYYAAQLVVALISGFAQIGADEGVDAKEAQATFVFALSPKLLEITRDMRRAAPVVLRKELAGHVRIYQRGIDLMVDAGVPPRVIRAIAKLDLDSDSGDLDIEDEVGISEAKLKAAGRRFATFGKDVIEWHPAPGAAAFLERASKECGIVPDDTVDCRALFTDEEVGALLGGAATLDDSQGCAWEAETAAGDESKLEVDVYVSRTPYERFADQHESVEPVTGLGDAAVTVSGYDSSSSFKSCGRTIVTRAGDQSVQVALCIGDGDDLAVEPVRDVAEQVLDRL